MVAVSGYGNAECIDCGRYGPRLLHEGFPHICSRCLFPPPPNPHHPNAYLTPPLVDVLVSRVKHTDPYRGKRVA